MPTLDDEPHDRSDFRSDLIDVRDLSLDQLRAIPNPILADTLRRVREQIEGRLDMVAGFQSAI
jgi:FXSXX-COOH protein